MSDSTKKLLLMIVAVIVGIWAVQIVLGLAIALVAKIVPLLILGAIGYGVYYFAFGGGRKSIGGGGRRSLP